MRFPEPPKAQTQRPRIVPPLLTVLAAHSLDASIVRVVRGKKRRQPLYGVQRLLRARVGSVGDAVVLPAIDFHAVHEKLPRRYRRRCSKQEVFQFPQFSRVDGNQLNRVAVIGRVLEPLLGCLETLAHEFPAFGRHRSTAAIPFRIWRGKRRGLRSGARRARAGRQR